MKPRTTHAFLSFLTARTNALEFLFWNPQLNGQSDGATDPGRPLVRWWARPVKAISAMTARWEPLGGYLVALTTARTCRAKRAT